MKTIDLILRFISIFISLFIFFKSTESMSGKIRFKNIKNLLLLFLVSILFLANTIYSELLVKNFICYFLYVIFLNLFHRTFNKKYAISSLITYLVMMVSEFLFTGILSYVLKLNLIQFMNSTIIQCFFTIFVGLAAYLFCKLKFIKKMYDLIFKLSEYKYVYMLLMAILVFITMFISAKYDIEFGFKGYLVNLVLLIIFIVIMFLSLQNNYKIDKTNQEKKILLEVISKYEKIIDENRICKHEMLNNLIILNSFKNKNTVEYKNTLSNLIDIYNSNDGGFIKNISKIPSGLKGILYYKINDIRLNGIKPIVHISKGINILDTKDVNSYVSLCKIIGIVLDNANEAAKVSHDKYLNVDIYQQNDVLHIIVENSCDKDVNINKIKNKNYSTKGKGRGLGLYVVDKLLKENNFISMSQEINNKIFTTHIVYQKKKGQ